MRQPVVTILAMTTLVAGKPAPVLAAPREAQWTTAPYLEGRFPAAPEQRLGEWTTQNAFPHLTFQNPTALVASPVDQRLYVCEREGRIYSFPKDRTVRVKRKVLDISEHCQAWGDTGGNNEVGDGVIHTFRRSQEIGNARDVVDFVPNRLSETGMFGLLFENLFNQRYQ